MTIYKQYAQAYSLRSLLEGKQLLGGKSDGLSDALGVNVSQFFTDFYNLETCNAQGLDNYGALLGYKRTVYIETPYKVLGFTNPQTTPTNDTDYPQNFYYANFWDGNSLQSLPDNEYRAVLRLLFRQTISDFSLRSLVLIVNEFFNDYAKFTNTTNTQQVSINVDQPKNRIIYNFSEHLTTWQNNVLLGVKVGSTQYNRRLLNAPLTMGVDFVGI